MVSRPQATPSTAPTADLVPTISSRTDSVASDTSPIIEAMVLDPSDASVTLREISLVTTDCSSTAAAIPACISAISRITLLISSIAPNGVDRV